MRENSLANRINSIFTSLKCKEIIDFLNQWNIDKLKLLTLVIESKIGYDRMISDNECRQFIEDIEEHVIYTTSEYSELIMFISTMGDVNSKFHSNASVLNKFQIFHKMLFKTGSLVLKLLTDRPVSSITAVKDQISVANPLFRADQITPFGSIQPEYDSKVFSIATAKSSESSISMVAGKGDNNEYEEEGEDMSLSNFLKSLASG